MTNRWLFLIHQLPPKPDYLRVKVRRRLQRIGAVALKNSVYVLPNRDEALEDFEWLLKEIEAEGGTATLCEGSLLDGLSDEELEGLFQTDRERAYTAIATEAQKLMATTSQDTDAPETDRIVVSATRLHRKFDEVAKLDFFRAGGRTTAELALAELRTCEERRGERMIPQNELGLNGRIWVTRQGIFVDRMASAWLIKRFIDPAALFKFVPDRGYKPLEGELRFDMYRAEFTHEGENCTFETLITRFGLDKDSALVALSEIVHDIDFKDDKFDKPQTAGVLAILRGIADTVQADSTRLEAGRPIFDGLYAELSGSNAPK